MKEVETVIFVPSTPGSKLESLLQAQDNLITYSIDVTALYPIIKKDMAEQAVMEAVDLAKLEWKTLI